MEPLRWQRLDVRSRPCGWLGILGRTELGYVRFRQATQNDVQLKTYELLIYGILIFSDRGWPRMKLQIRGDYHSETNRHKDPCYLTKHTIVFCTYIDQATTTQEKCTGMEEKKRQSEDSLSLVPSSTWRREIAFEQKPKGASRRAVPWFGKRWRFEGARLICLTLRTTQLKQRQTCFQVSWKLLLKFDFSYL